MEKEIKLTASIKIQHKHIANGETRDIIHITVNDYKLTGFGIYAPEKNKPNTQDQLDFAQSIVNKLNQK